jgi:NO-binding membrane sensor protein with MHYT domain
MQLAMQPDYSPPMVALSFLISALGAFAALTASSRIVGPGGRLNLLNAVISGTALGGIGVWSMHFIGMLAVRVNMGVSYSIPETFVSLVAAVAGSAGALLWVARRPSLPRLAGAGVLLGLGVCVMHYLGMYGMRFAGFFEWSAPLVGVSVAIAIVAATAALWLAFVVRSLAARLAASLVMACAVCAMHYTGMGAATFICTSPEANGYPMGPWLITALELPALVTTVALGVAVVILVDQAFQRMQPQAGSASPRRAGPPTRPPRVSGYGTGRRTGPPPV